MAYCRAASLRPASKSPTRLPPHEKALTEEVRMAARAGIPAGRDGDPDERAIVAFPSSEPAAYVDGASVPVDGGMLKSLG
jgi:NAD(P)-dependent dehydrogenase (short-subunit alcohol dehydrogenase family)